MVKLSSQSALSIGVSLLIGVSAWLLLAFAVLAAGSLLRQRMQYHAMLRAQDDEAGWSGLPAECAEDRGYARGGRSIGEGTMMLMGAA